MNSHLLATAAAAAMSVALAAQTPSPEPLPGFEASIKRTQDTSGFMGMRMDPQGRTVTGLPLRQLIVQAYGIQPNQIIGGPDWLTSDRWDIQLRADAPVNPQQMNLLVQKMMAERFKLVVHRETRELPIFELRLARADGQPGPSLKPAAVDCGPQGRGRPGGPPPAAGAPGPGAAPGRGPAPLAGCRLMIAPGRAEASGQPLTALTNFLSNQLGRNVVDKTGLTGGFDYTLEWLPDQGRGGVPFNPPPGAPPLPPINPDAPSLPTALQEQLGLRLESTKGPVEVLVIDSVQQPTEN